MVWPELLIMGDLLAHEDSNSGNKIQVNRILMCIYKPQTSVTLVAESLASLLMPN